MSKMIVKTIRERVKVLLNGGFFHILGSSVINKFIAFFANLILVRILSKNDFGIFTGAFNDFSLIYIFSGLGITSGILYFCSKNITSTLKTKYYLYSVKFGIASECLLSAALIIYGLWGPVGIEETRFYIITLSLLPFVAFVFDYFSVILRAEKDNKRYSVLLNIHSFLYALLAIIGAYSGGILGTIIGRYLSYVIAGTVGYYFTRGHFSASHRDILSKKEKGELVSYSLKAGATSALNVILYRIDVKVIAIVVANASILASYKIGTTLPENLTFIPQCMMVYYIPLFLQNIDNAAWIKRKTKEIYVFVGAVSVSLGAIVILFAPHIIGLLWGKDYLDAVTCMRILALSFIVLSTFRITSTNILLSLKRTGYTLFVSIITGLSNILLDIVLTIRYGSIGAAYATLIVTILAALLSFPYVIYIVYSGKQTYE